MKKRSGWLPAAVLGIGFTLAAGASEAALTSAQLEIIQQQQSGGTNLTTTHKIWIKGNKARAEMKHPMAGEMLMISDGRHMYVLNPTQKMGRKQPLPTRNGKQVSVLQMLLAPVDELRKGKKVGRETVGGVPCDIYVRSENKEGQSSSLRAWVGTVQNTALPMKVVAKGTMKRPGATVNQSQTLTIKNLKTNIAIPDSRFAVPAGYKITTAGQPTGPIPGAGRPVRP